MRAILLVKDREGMMYERLKGRYGLTGKLVSESISNSLSSSFLSSQEITSTDMRSLNSKLKEAQQAIDSSRENLRNSEDVQDKMEDAVDKIQRLLSSTLWEKLWSERISPFTFYAGKYSEDQADTAMAGEIGYPVQNIGNVIDYTPLPRVQYWDPALAFGDMRLFRQPTDYKLKTINPGYNNKVYDSENAYDDFLTDQTVRFLQDGDKIDLLSAAIKDQDSVLLSVIGTLTGLVVIVSIGGDASAVAEVSGTYIITSAAAYAALKILRNWLDNLMNGGFELFYGYNPSNFVNPPPVFRRRETNYESFIAFGAGWIKQVTDVTEWAQAVFMVFLIAMMATISVGVALRWIPWTMAVGIAMIRGALFALGTMFPVWVTYIGVSLWTMLEQIAQAAVTRSILDTSGDRITSEISEQGKLKDYNDVISGNDVNLNFITVLAAVLGGFVSLIIPQPDNVDCGLRTVYKLTNNSKFTFSIPGNYSSRLAYRPFNSWWPTSSVWLNINDKVSGAIVSGMVESPQITGYVKLDSNWKSFVYSGDYFGTKHNIRLFKNETILETVVVLCRHVCGMVVNYGCGVLVRTAKYPSQLQLLWERTAFYDVDDNAYLPYMEQVIYNYDVNSVPADDFISQTGRNGRLHRVYGDVVVGEHEELRFQLRNVISEEDNVLNGKVISKAYKFDDTILTGNPNVTVWGNINSYRF